MHMGRVFVQRCPNRHDKQDLPYKEDACLTAITMCDMDYPSS